MPYTFVPGQKHAKASGRDMRMSVKSAKIICRVIRNKPLVRSRRLLNNLLDQTQSLDGKYYTKTAREILSLLQSCEKNAEFLGLDADKLFVHASVSKGTNLRRRRRKSKYGSKLKSANMEIMLVERGKESKHKISKKKLEEEKQKVKHKTEAEEAELKGAIEEAKEKSEGLKKKVDAQ